MDAKEVQLLLQKLATEYSGNTYNLITRNCNHFCNDLCMRLTKKSIPNWVNRLARLGNNLHGCYFSLHSIFYFFNLLGCWEGWFAFNLSVSILVLKFAFFLGWLDATICRNACSFFFFFLFCVIFFSYHQVMVQSFPKTSFIFLFIT